MKQHFAQILIGLFVTIVGGVAVYLVTTTEASPVSVEIDDSGLLELKVYIDGAQNDIFLGRGNTEMTINNISVKGSQKDLTYNIPPNYKVYLNVDGHQNTVHIDYRLKDFVFVNDQGTMSRVYFTDE